MIKVCFVCLGNICRSPMAEFIFKDMVKSRHLDDKIMIESRATSNEEVGNFMHIGTTTVLDKNNISYEQRYAKQLKLKDYDNFNYFIGMDWNNILAMKKIFKNTNEKIYRLLDFTPLKMDIADPWYTHNFDKTYEQITMGCQYFLEFLIKKEKL